MAGDWHQRAVPGPGAERDDQLERGGERPQRAGRAAAAHLERRAAAQVRLAGRRARHQLRRPAGLELDLPVPGQGPGRQLLLLPSTPMHRAAGATARSPSTTATSSPYRSPSPTGTSRSSSGTGTTADTGSSGGRSTAARCSVPPTACSSTDWGLTNTTHPLSRLGWSTRESMSSQVSSKFQLAFVLLLLLHNLLLLPSS